MKITKFAHSCLFVEDNNTTYLLDPGIYTYEEKILSPKKLSQLDYILITHSHADHVSVPFVKELIAAFPTVTIISNNDVAKMLEEEHIPVRTTSTQAIQLSPVPHEKILGASVPENTQFDIADRLTHPGDSLTFSQTQPILALPIQAPWGSFTWALDVASRLKPRVVIPIHDWHWKDIARRSLYQRAAEYLKQQGIEFIQIEDGVSREV